MKKRARFEQLMALLEAINQHKGWLGYRLAAFTRVNWNVYKERLGTLERKGLVSAGGLDEKKRYYLTKRGYQVLVLWGEIKEMLALE